AAPGRPHPGSVSGIGASLQAPQVDLSPSSLDFGATRVGGDASQRLRLANSAGLPLAITGIGVSGALFGQVNDCPPSLGVGASCGITVSYAPGTIGAHSGQLRIESNAIPSPFVASISGSAIAIPPPFLAVDRSVDFGQQVVGTI